MAIGRSSGALAALAAAFLIVSGAAPAAASGPNEAGLAEPAEGILVPAGAGAVAEPATGAAGEPAEGEAEEQDTEEQEVDVEELERRIELLAEELERLRSGEPENEVTIDQARALGLAPSAASTYAIDSGVSIAGYGEVLYENYASETSQYDMLRAILYAGYRFNDKFLFNSEIEVEHAKEIFVEFAYVDYLATPNFGLRAGMLMIPMGLVNEFHEPTVFIGAERPVTESRIIPTTWRENGGGFYGAFDNVAFRAYVVNGFNGAKFSSAGLRGGRQKGGKALADDMAFTGRLDITPIPGAFFGASFYTGGSGQSQVLDDSGRTYGVRTDIFDVHAQVQARGVDFRALFAQAGLDDTSMLNQVLGLEGKSGVAEKMQGGYVQLGYDLLSQSPGAAGVALTPYLRYEKVDTHTALAAGFTRDPGKNNTYTTFGIELKPNPGVVLKVDHMWVGNAVDSGVDQFNVSVGYAF